MGPFPVICSFRDNAYEDAFPREIKLHSVFHVQDSSPFNGDHVPTIALPLDRPQVAPLAHDRVDIVLNYRASGDLKVIDHYLIIKWKIFPESES